VRHILRMAWASGGRACYVIFNGIL